ncbi:MAG TPA: NADPH-dependent F420 reductase, partial [Dehalococcoidia bacterium]|nr:NADPH-dependent F420 reductase [Dehalococcoidia bacterium]
EERANQAAAKVKEKEPNARVQGMSNASAAEKAEIIFLAVPFSAHRETLLSLTEAIGDKVLVDVVVPLEFAEDGPHALLVEEGSMAQQARLLVPRAKVVSAFHHLDARKLQDISKPMQGDVIVCADHKGAKKTVMEQAEKIEYIRALDGGGLGNAHYLEAWTAMLVHLNRIYKARTGIRITGI